MALDLKTADGDLQLITEPFLLTRCAWLSHAKYCAALLQTIASGSNTSPLSIPYIAFSQWNNISLELREKKEQIKWHLLAETVQTSSKQIGFQYFDLRVQKRM